MDSQATFHHHLRQPVVTTTVWSSSSSSLQHARRNHKKQGIYTIAEGVNNRRLRCNAISPDFSRAREILQPNGFTRIKLKDENEEEKTAFKIKKLIEAIKGMLSSMEDGEISVSAYDTAWVALIEDTTSNNGNGTHAPQFPSSLQWIVDNQLHDGSWGDRDMFLAHDRILNTLACVIALKKWNTHNDKSEKGMRFIRENIHKLAEEESEHMPIGFEVAFPSLYEIARSLDLEILEDSHPLLQSIYEQRDLKLTRIPKEMMHVIPTTLLHSLEGMVGLNWEKLLKLQSSDGSFLFSPSSTAFALMQTQDHNCFNYLNRALHKFNGGVPNVYPVDLFEHIWAVDRLERLGISRYFLSEIKESLNHVYRYWTEDGICWARNSTVQDIDDTAMGFRLLRLHGHDVSPDVFRRFQKNGEFFCFVGQSTQAVTGMFNLYRASQVMFPGEDILEEAKAFSSQFLREKQASKQLLDKWIITKDLPGEVDYALNVPWYASLPRIEARFFIEQYGGDNDIWIGKTLYRMPYVNNNSYLELAKLDFNNCQALHRLEWVDMQKWHSKCNLTHIGSSRRTLLHAYFLAAASIFEPEKSIERLAWAKTSVLVDAVSSYFAESSADKRVAFIDEFNESYTYSINNYEGVWRGWKMTRERHVLHVLLETLNRLSLDVLVAHGIDISHHIRCCWDTWMMTWTCDKEGEEDKSAELIVRMIVLCAGRSLSYEVLSSSPELNRLGHLTNRLCRNLRLVWISKQELQLYQANNKESSVRDLFDNNVLAVQLNSDMQELVHLGVGCGLNDDSVREIAQTFLSVAKTYYYTAHCAEVTINRHIAMVLLSKLQ